MRKIKILIADDEEMLRDIVEMLLESFIENCEFIKAINGAKAIEALQTISDIDFIISDYTMPVKNGAEVFLYNKANANLPFVMISGGSLSDYPKLHDFKLVNSLNYFLEKPYEENQFVNCIQKIIQNIGSMPTHNSTEAIEKLIKVDLKHYLKYSSSINNVYLSLHQDKYTKISDENQDITSERELLNRYLDKGVNYIYIPKDKFEKLIKDYLERIQSYHLPEETIQLTSQALHLSLSSLTEMGLSDFQFELITSVVDETISELSNNKKLSKLFSTYLKNESYIVSHSLYTIYIAGLILKETHYSYTHTMKKISYAAFLHDLALETDPFAEYEMHLRPELTSAELKKVEEHPINSAKLIPDDNDMFEDARKIILEHHEKPNGTGYPKKLDGTKTFTLSCVFNIAHDISTFLIKNEYQVDLLPTFLQRNKEYYSIGNYEKFYQIALTIF